MDTINKELLEEIKNCIDDAVENIADGYPDIAESSLQDAAYILYKIEDKDTREKIAASFEINPLDFGI
jgi:hypothetical protein